MQGHPWVFSGAIGAWSTTPRPGQSVDVVSANGDWLARGLAHPAGNLAVQVYTRDESQALSADFFRARLAAAIDWRERVVLPQEPDTDSFRLCFSEADGLSGLIVDRYADRALMQISAPSLAPYIPVFKDELSAHGLEPLVEQVEEAAPGSPSAPVVSRPVTIRESGLRFEMDLGGGQKTGFYLDQRVNRRRAAAYAAGRRCLSAYCYTGSFETHFVRAGAASVTGLDRSEPALALARRNQALNPGPVSVDYHAADVPTMLRKYRDSRTSFDLIVLDPPKFVASQGQIDKGLRAYKDINLLAMKLLTPGGILVTFSCSGWVKAETFRTALEWAAADAGRDAQILEPLAQPPDHPVHISFPEGDYLCGFILRIA